jgi:hypothetical protein
VLTFYPHLYHSLSRPKFTKRCSTEKEKGRGGEEEECLYHVPLLMDPNYPTGTGPGPSEIQHLDINKGVAHLLTHYEHCMSVSQHLKQYHTEGVFLWWTVANRAVSQSEPTKKLEGREWRHPTSPRQNSQNHLLAKLSIAFSNITSTHILTKSTLLLLSTSKTVYQDHKQIFYCMTTHSPCTS